MDPAESEQRAPESQWFRAAVIPVTSMSAEELRALPPVIDLPTAARVLGIGRTAAYSLVRSGEWPSPILRLGGTIRVPTAPLLALIGQTTAA